MTYTAVAVMALAASSGWWPTKDEPEDGAAAPSTVSVQITDGSGRSACGQLVEGPTGRIRLTTDEGTVEVATSGVASIVPVDNC